MRLRCGKGSTEENAERGMMNAEGRGNSAMEGLRILAVLVLLFAVSGCGKRQDMTAEKQSIKPESSLKTAVADKPESKVAEPAQVEKQVKLPGYLEKTKNMPAGMDKARAVEKEYVAEQIPKLEKLLMESSEGVSLAEKKARASDPKIGRLYKEMIDARIAYNKALAANAEYAAAHKKSIDTLKEYHRLIERRKVLAKEIKNDK